MRFTLLGLNLFQFDAAVLNVGPQRLRIDNERDLLVIMSIAERPGWYVALADDTYVPVLISLNGPTGGLEPYEIDTISDELATPFSFDNPRLVLLDDLAQRLAEHQIKSDTPVTAVAQSAVDLWFNAGLIPVESAAPLTIAFAGRHGWHNAWTFQQLDECGDADTLGLRQLVAEVVRGIAEKMLEGYRRALPST